MKTKVFLHPKLHRQIQTLLGDVVAYVEQMQDADVAVFEDQADIPKCSRKIFCIYAHGNLPSKPHHYHLPDGDVSRVRNEILNGEAYKNFLAKAN